VKQGSEELKYAKLEEGTGQACWTGVLKNCKKGVKWGSWTPHIHTLSILVPLEWTSC